MFKHIFILFILFGCSANENVNNESLDEKSKVIKEAIEDSSLEENSQHEIITHWMDTLDTLTIPRYQKYPLQLLTKSRFHKGELNDSVSYEDWIGLFRKDSEYYIKEAKVLIKHVHNPIVDGIDEKSGLQVTIENDSSENILLLADLPLKEGLVPHEGLDSWVVSPGDTVSFSFLNYDYTLYATGYKTSKDHYNPLNYKLWLYSNYQQRPQLLVAHGAFSDEYIDIRWAGDIDADGKLDLLIDTSNHYNKNAPTLYLSSFAENENLLKIVAMLIGLGC